MLTRSEQEVLHALADYGSVAAIGERLHITPATVKSHLRSLRCKLGVHTAPQFVAVGLRLGLIR